jgi:hypothetical protein
MTNFKIIIIIVSITVVSHISFAQLGINGSGTAPAASAMLDVSSTTKGFLPPRMTSAQRTAITSPVEGLLVFDTNTKSNWYFNGSSWVNDVPGAALALPYSATEYGSIDGTLFQITNSGPGSAIKGVLNQPYGRSESAAIKGINNSGNGNAGYFENTDASDPALKALTNSNGVAFFAENTGYGDAAEFISRSTLYGSALFAESFGLSETMKVDNNGDGRAIVAENNSTYVATEKLTNFATKGVALELDGGLKVSDRADRKPAFKITSTVGNIYVNQLRIPNTTQANDPDDIIIITHNYGTGATNNFTKACGVYWDAGFSEWRIYVEDSTAMPVGITFNVLVIKQ